MTTCYLAPDPFQSTWFVPGSATPANGAQLFFYTNLTTTKTTVYKDPAGSTAWSNPIVLDSGGNLPNGATIWIPTGITVTVVYAPSNDSDPPTSPYRTFDYITGMNDVGSQSGLEWISGPTPTFVSATSFTLAGDQTSNFQVGRRVRTSNTGGTIYSRITGSVFGALTTVTVVNDSGNLDAGLSAVSYGLLAATNPSVPVLRDVYPHIANGTNPSKTIQDVASSLSASTNRLRIMPDYDVRLSNMPAGIGPIPFAGTTAPTGWLECDGSAISRTTYAALFTAIGTIYGGGNSSTTFNIPDCRGRTIIGRGTGVYTEGFSSSALSITASTATVSSNADTFVTGMQLTWNVISGTAPTTVPANLLDNGDTVYVIRNNATSISFASTLATAQNGVQFGISSTGAGLFSITHTLTTRSIAQRGGEDVHAISSTETLSHNHGNGQYRNATTAGAIEWAVGAAQNTVLAAFGGNTAMNNMQPYIVMMYVISY